MAFHVHVNITLNSWYLLVEKMKLSVTLQCRHCSKELRPWDKQTWTFWVVNQKPMFGIQFPGNFENFESRSPMQGNGTVLTQYFHSSTSCRLVPARAGSCRPVPARAGRNHVPDPFCSVISIICTPISEPWSKLSTCGMVIHPIMGYYVMINPYNVEPPPWLSWLLATITRID